MALAAANRPRRCELHLDREASMAHAERPDFTRFRFSSEAYLRAANAAG